MLRRLAEKFKGMMRSLFRQEGAALDIGIIADPEVREFIDTHASVLDASMEKVEMSDGMRRRLSRSNFIFSGMKTFHELNEAFPSLIDENGNRKSFERFLNDVQKIDQTYNEHYLRAEYNFVNASAEMAARWESFADDGDRYNLQYRTAGDGKVRPEHAALNGITLPMSDPFWEDFYPPNGWNCRCTVVQVRKSKYPATPHDEAMARGEEALQRDSKGIFRFNPGLEEKTFPDYNPYTIRKCRNCPIAKGDKSVLAHFVPEHQLCETCQNLRQCKDQRMTANFQKYKKDLKHEAQIINNKKYKSLRTGAYYQTHGSFGRGVRHAWNIEEADMYQTIIDYIDDFKYIAESPLGEVKDMTNPVDIANIQSKIERHVTTYHIYEVTINNVTWVVKTEVYKNQRETVYHLMKKKIS